MRLEGPGGLTAIVIVSVTAQIHQGIESVATASGARR